LASASTPYRTTPGIGGRSRSTSPTLRWGSGGRGREGPDALTVLTAASTLGA
jgi:hypothetical protein